MKINPDQPIHPKAPKVTLRAIAKVGVCGLAGVGGAWGSKTKKAAAFKAASAFLRAWKNITKSKTPSTPSHPAGS